MQPPHLKNGQLYVKEKPFLALGGELGNSSASDLKELDGIFAKLHRMNLNTVMLPVYWDRIEPKEGHYDFHLVQGAVELARKHDLHLVYLWFGTWKNSMSCYAPGWVKRDQKRFPRVRTSNGEAQEIITPHSAECLKKDSAAFAALMRWTKEFDADQQTVIMAQVENEVGMIPEARDHSPEAEAAYQQEAPKELRAAAGSWKTVFGPGPEGEELFTAWYLARYVDQVAAAGQKEYPLPMYANAALIRPGYHPGQYPSGGPLPHLMDVWKLGAPHLSMISPDIYFPSFCNWADQYAQAGNPLFIPEMAPSTRAAANAVYAIGQKHAIGVGPFAIENLSGEKEADLTQCYGQLALLAPQILEAQTKSQIIGLSPDLDFDWKPKREEETANLNGVTFHATFDKSPALVEAGITTLPTLGVGRWEAPPGTPLGAAMAIQIGPEEFLVFGKGVTITFATAKGREKVGIEEVQEGTLDAQGNWVGGRWLNGDETHQGRHIHLSDKRWSFQRVRLYRYT